MVSVVLEFTGCFHTKIEREELQVVAYFDILQISHRILTDNQNQTLLKPLVLIFLVLYAFLYD